MWHKNRMCNPRNTKWKTNKNQTISWRDTNGREKFIQNDNSIISASSYILRNFFLFILIFPHSTILPLFHFRHVPHHFICRMAAYEFCNKRVSRWWCRIGYSPMHRTHKYEMKAEAAVNLYIAIASEGIIVRGSVHTDAVRSNSYGMNRIESSLLYTNPQTEQQQQQRRQKKNY